MKKTVMNIKAFMMVCILMCATASLAANGVWNGTVNTAWTNSANWSNAPVPSGNDTAWFSNSGSGQTLIDLAGLSSIRYITYDSPAVAAYTNGTGAANSQTLIMADGGEIKITDTAANSQLFNAGLQLGASTVAGTYTLNNLNTNHTLTFNQVFGALSGGTAAAKTLVVSGPGNTTILGDIWRGGATTLTLTQSGTGTLAMSGSNTVLTLNMNGGSNSVVDIGSGYLSLENGGGTVLQSTQGGIINGTGTLRLSTATGNNFNYADVKPAAGKTLVINPTVVSTGGFELNDAGKVVLNGINTFAGEVYFTAAGTISVSKIGNKGSTDSNLGMGSKIFMTTDNCTLQYTGIGETTDRIVELSKNFTLDHSGTGTLTLSAPMVVLANAKTLTLQGSTAGVGVIPESIKPGLGTTALTKNGSGTWVLGGANGYGGATTVNGGTLILTGANAAITNSSGYTVNAGATLLLENASAANNTNRLSNTSTITLNGGTLSITNNGGAVNYSESAGALSIGPGGASTIATTEADVNQTNTLTVASLAYNGGRINFTGTGIGASDRNRIFITTGMTNGLIGPWATINGTSYAAYDSTLGVYAFTETTDIAAEGGTLQSVIPDNGALLARINLSGVSGPITLQGQWTNNIAQVLQNTTTNTTIETLSVDTNKTLQTAGLSIAAGKAALTVGSSQNDGFLAPLNAGGTLVLENNNTSELLTVNAAVINNTSASKLSKTGPGTVVLTGTNTYSGNTFISEGVLAFGSSLNQTVATAISGGGTLGKTGSGTLNLNVANTFTGGTLINEGTVATAQAGGLGIGAVTNNSTLNLTGGAQTYTGLSTGLAGAGTNNVTLATGGTATAIFNGDYSSFTGIWNIGMGRVANQSKAQMNGLDNSAATINILSNATLYCATPVTHNAALVLEGGNTYEALGQLRLDVGASWAGPITLIGPITDSADAFFGNGAASIISGIISDLGNGFTVDKLSAGTLTFSGANTYSGPTWVKAGAISVPAMGSISGGASPLGSQTSADAGRVRLGTGGTAASLIYTGAGEDTDRMIDLAGTTGGVTLDQSGSGLLKLTGGMMISGSGNKTLTLQGSTTGTGEFAGAITNGTGSTISVTKAGTGTWTLSGPNTYTGTTTVSGGILDVTGSLTTSPITFSGGFAPKVIGRSATALGSGEIYFSDAGGGVGLSTTPVLELKINGGGVISLPNNLRANSGMVDTIDVDNNGSGTDGIIQFNGATCNFGNTTINVTGANGYSLYLANVRNTAGGAGTMTLNPTSAALGIGTISGSFATPLIYTIALGGTYPSNTVTGIISDKAGAGNTTIAITKLNTSTWTLTGVNTYTGATTVVGGTLLVNAPGSLAAASAVTVSSGAILGGSGTLNGPVTANGGGKLAPGGVGTISTQNLGSSLTLNGGQLLFDISNVSTDKVVVAGALMITSVNIVDLSLLDGSLPAGTYTLMTYASKSGSGSFALARGYPNATLSSDSTSLVLTVGTGGMSSGMTWKGTFSTSWDGLDLNWDSDGVVTNFTAGDLVTFDDTAANFTVGSASAVLPGYVAFNNANDYTVSAAIDGTAQLVKMGTGATTLTGLNTYNPSSVTVNAGMLTLGGTSRLNSGLYAGAIFNDSLLNYASSATQTNSGSISGVGSLLHSGSGTLALASSNAFSGTVTVNGGVLQLQNAFALGTTAVGTTVNAGGTLDLAGSISYPAEALNLYGILSNQTGSNTYTGIVSLRSGSSIDVGAGSFLILTANTPDLGASPFSKTGAGTLRLTADPNHRGICTVAEGTLDLRGGGTTDADFIINPGATLMETTANLGNYRLTVNGTFDMRIGDDINGLDGSGLVTIGNTGSYTFTIGNGNQSGAFSGVMQDGTGKLAFTKNGSGIQTLSGVNTYTGATIVAGGTLLINAPGSLTNTAVTINNGCTLGGTGAIYGPVNMAAVSTLLPGGANVIGTLTLANDSATALTLNTSLLRYDISNNAGVCDQIALTGTSGNLVLNGVNVIVLSFPNGAAPVGTYTLMTFNSYTGSGSFELDSAYPNASLQLNAGSLVLNVAGGSTYSGLIWKGFFNGVWDSEVQNWNDGTSPATYTPGDAVIFDDTAWGNLTVSSGATVSPASMFFNNSVNAYTISANVSGTGPLIKLGSSGLTLSNVTTYNPSVLTLSGTFTLSGASRLNSGNYGSNINNNATFNYTSTQPQILGGVISGLGSLVKDSNSTLTLTGTNTYTGNTTVRGGGILKIQNDSALGTTATGTTVTNGTLELAGDITTPAAEGLTLYGTLSSQTGTNTYGGTVTTAAAASSFNVGAGSMLILKAFQANGSYTKVGAGWLKLTIDPNGTGVMTINNGVAELAQVSGSTESDIVVNNGATLIESIGAINDINSVTVNAGGIFDLRQSDTIAALNGAGLVTKGTPGAATLTVGGNNASGTFSGVIQDGSGTLGFTKAGTGTATLSGKNTFSGNMSTAGMLILTGAGQFGGGVYLGTIANTGLFVHDSSATQTLSGAISGTAGVLRKTGTGKLLLAGVNTYTGATSLSNGVLLGVTGGSCASSAVTNAAAAGKSATLGVLITDNTKQWTCSSLVIANAGVSSSLEFDFGTVAPSTTLAPFKVNNAVTFTTTPSVTVKASNISGVPGTVYPLMTWTTTSGTAPTTVTVISSLRPITAHLTVTGSTLNLVIDSNGGPLLWTDGGAKTWNTDSGNMIWQDPVASLVAYNEATLPGDTVVFSDSNLVADTTVTLNSIVTPGGVSITNDLYQYTISGSGGIAGPVGLTKSGTNTLTLATANSFIGHTTILGGTLKLANAAALPALNTLAMAGAGKLDMNGYPTAITNISASVAGNTITDGSAGAGTTPLAFLNQAATVSALIKDGPAKSIAVSLANANVGSPTPFALNAANTYSGGLTVKHSPLNNGTRLYVNAAVSTVGSAGNITSSPFGRGAITIGDTADDKAQIWIGGVNNINIHNDIVVNSTLGTDQIYAIRNDTTGNMLNGAITANADLSIGTTGTGSVTLTNTISGAGGVKLAAGAITVTLAGQNTYTGKTTIPSAGALVFTSIGNVGSGPSNLGAPTTAANGTITVGNGTTVGMTLLYRGMGHTTDRVLELAGTTGGLTVNHSGTNLLKFTSDLLMSGSGAKRFQMTGANNATGEVAGVIGNSPAGAVNVYKNGTASTWRLSGANTFTDAVEINEGVLIITHSQALGLGNKNVIVKNGSAGNPQLHLDGSAGPITLGTNLTFQTSNQTSGSIHNRSGTNTIEGKVTMTGGGGDTWLTSWADKLYMRGNMSADTSIRQLRLRGNGDGEISGIIANGSTTNLPVLRDSGTGTWILSGTNTYSGATTISSGTLAVGNDQALGVSNVVNLAGGNLGGAIGTWSITNTVNVQNNSGIITEGMLTLTGAITNNAGLTKTGAGTLLLNGSKTGTGALTVSAGILGGTGTLAGAVTNQATITAADTNAIGTLTVANLDMASNSTLFWNCNSATQDIINATGTLTLPAVATVIVDEDIIGDLGLAPRVLVTFGTGPAPMLLANWTVVGAPPGTSVRVGNNQVYLVRPGGTMISIF